MERLDPDLMNVQSCQLSLRVCASSATSSRLEKVDSRICIRFDLRVTITKPSLHRLHLDLISLTRNPIHAIPPHMSKASHGIWHDSFLCKLSVLFQSTLARRSGDSSHTSAPSKFNQVEDRNRPIA